MYTLGHQNNLYPEYTSYNEHSYNAFNVYRRELVPGTVSLTGDRAQGDDSKHWAYTSIKI